MFVVHFQLTQSAHESVVLIFIQFLPVFFVWSCLQLIRLIHPMIISPSFRFLEMISNWRILFQFHIISCSSFSLRSSVRVCLPTTRPTLSSSQSMLSVHAFSRLSTSSSLFLLWSKRFLHLCYADRILLIFLPILWCTKFHWVGDTLIYSQWESERKFSIHQKTPTLCSKHGKTENWFTVIHPRSIFFCTKFSKLNFSLVLAPQNSHTQNRYGVLHCVTFCPAKLFRYIDTEIKRIRNVVIVEQSNQWILHKLNFVCIWSHSVLTHGQTQFVVSGRRIVSYQSIWWKTSNFRWHPMDTKRNRTNFVWQIRDKHRIDEKEKKKRRIKHVTMSQCHVEFELCWGVLYCVLFQWKITFFSLVSSSFIRHFHT